MRLPLLMGALLLGVLLAAALAFFRPASRPQPAARPPAAPAAAGPLLPDASLAPVSDLNAAPGHGPSNSVSPEPGRADRNVRAPTNAVPADPEDALRLQQRAYVEKRVAELEELGMRDDPPALDTILSELTNRDPEIRQAALEATVQFRSRDAIPRLLDAAAQIDDPHEKAAIADAIEFLKLPALNEVLSPQKDNPATNPAPGKQAP